MSITNFVKQTISVIICFENELDKKKPSMLIDTSASNAGKLQEYMADSRNLKVILKKEKRERLLKQVTKLMNSIRNCESLF
jgi:hypothetical protein